LAFSAIVGGMIIALISLSVLQSRTTRYELERTGALSIAEGVTDIAKAFILQDVANSSLFDGVPEESWEETASIAGVEVDWTAYPIGEPISRVDPDGVTLSIQPYEISAEQRNGTGFARVSQIVDVTLTPLFQFMIFYNDDLEIHPGPTMFLEGRVHTNGDMYLGANNTLKVDTDYLRATGSFHRHKKNGDTQSGSVSVRVSETTVPDTPQFVNMALDEDSSLENWTGFALETWQGTVQDGSHGVTALAAPELPSIEVDPSEVDPFQDPDPEVYRYFHEAGLRIKGTGSDYEAYDGNGHQIFLPLDVIKTRTMYDARERTYVTLTEIDMEELNASGHFPENGLIYAYRDDTSSSQPNGICLTNGAELLAPLTVVTEAPLYIEGDYNTVEKKGCAVIADAVNLLSNAWDNSRQGPADPDDLPPPPPTASDTTYNLAMITGNVPTPDGYSGGFENLPRFHEKWRDGGGKVDCNINGAFACLYESQYAKESWGKKNVYVPPQRNWFYDPDLLDPDNLPPGTPNAVYVRRVLWDDGVNMTFQSAHGAGYPANTPIYNPWDYDPGFMDKVIEDPYAG
jgi:hypothetical protein